MNRSRAELYLSYDVAELTFVSFENMAETRRFIDLLIYDMGFPTNAFGIFSVERSRDEPPVDLGRAGYRSGANYYRGWSRTDLELGVEVSMGDTDTGLLSP